MEAVETLAYYNAMFFQIMIFAWGVGQIWQTIFLSEGKSFYCPSFRQNVYHGCTVIAFMVVIFVFNLGFKGKNGDNFSLYVSLGLGIFGVLGIFLTAAERASPQLEGFCCPRFAGNAFCSASCIQGVYLRLQSAKNKILRQLGTIVEGENRCDDGVYGISLRSSPISS
jgi:hypothetical protein